MGLLQRIFGRRCTKCDTLLVLKLKRFDFEPDEYICPLCHVLKRKK